jgi:hypothetical protein
MFLKQIFYYFLNKNKWYFLSFLIIVERLRTVSTANGGELLQKVANYFERWRTTVARKPLIF